MGGDLAPASAGKAPKFLVWGVRDPNGGYLQRAQIVKGWIENGVAKEQVFDVACSDNLALNTKTWRCPDNGAAVNMATCEPDRFKGDVELAGYVYWSSMHGAVMLELAGLLDGSKLDARKIAKPAVEALGKYFGITQGTP